MNKKLYSLMALGTFLFAVACSDNDSPISGSTSVPNMGNNLNVPQSPVLCSVMGVTDSLEALEKGCIWSPEMWGPTTGYRVRTGYDNGTNTSGIWTVSTYPENANVIIEWPGNATTEYDSMALADVIDKCGGSLCGKVLFKNENSLPDSDTRREVYFDFYLAGKNASGKVESVDARDMEGICVSYLGNIIEFQLIPDDSIAALMGPNYYNYPLPSLYKRDYSKVEERCFSWGYQPSLDDVHAHLKGFRFVLSENYGEVDKEQEFKIIGISRYKTPRVSSNNLRPERTDCEPVSVASSFCECEFSDDMLNNIRTASIWHSYSLLVHELDDDEEASLSDSAKSCLGNTFVRLHNFSLDMFDKPCDNPLPKDIMCSDGTTSLSIELVEIWEEFQNKLLSQSIDANAIADSLFNHCLSL